MPGGLGVVKELRPGITCVIPTIPPREQMLKRAIRSVEAQTLPVDHIIIERDTTHAGAGPTREKGMRKVLTEHIIFCDDDDFLEPNMAEVCMRHAVEQNADVVFSWFFVEFGTDPFPSHRSLQWNGDDPNPRIFPITTLVRTELAQNTPEGIFPRAHTIDLGWEHQDYPFWRHIWDQGGKFFHTPEQLWTYSHHNSNTSGLADRW